MPSNPSWTRAARIPISCLIVGRTPDSAQARRLVEACVRAGLEVRAVDVLTASQPRLDADPGEAPARLLRLASGTPQVELDALVATAAAEARAPGLWLDDLQAVQLAHDKPRALATLAANGLPVPPSLLVVGSHPLHADALPGDTLVIKPARGSAGRGVRTALPRAEALARAANFAALCGAVILQPQLGDGTDRRVFLVDGEPVAAMERRPSEPGGRGNAARGAQAVAWEPEESDVDLARAAARALGLSIAGVDLLHTSSGATILEVNACPGLIAIEAATGRDVAGSIASAWRSRLSAR